LVAFRETCDRILAAANVLILKELMSVLEPYDVLLGIEDGPIRMVLTNTMKGREFPKLRILRYVNFLDSRNLVQTLP